MEETTYWTQGESGLGGGGLEQIYNGIIIKSCFVQQFDIEVIIYNCLP